VRRKPIITKLKFFEKPSRSERVSIGKLKKNNIIISRKFLLFVNKQIWYCE